MGLWRCFVYLATIGILCFLLGRILPKRWFHADEFPYRCYPFERGGRIYERLGIKKWQNRVLDMSRILPGLMPAKAMDGRSVDKLPLMIRETCVAEFTHKLLAVLGLYCLRLWPGIGGMIVAILYILLGNLPFILIQRYNRPRLLKLMKKCGLSDCEIPVEQGGQYAYADFKVRGAGPMRFSLALHALLLCCRGLPWRHHACATAPRTSTYFANENSST